MSELKPCPFCRGKPRMWRTDFEKVTLASPLIKVLECQWKVMCDGCWVMATRTSRYTVDNDEKLKVYDGWDGKKQIIELWNRRAET